MPVPPRQLPKIRISTKLHLLRTARELRAGGLLAHNTSTLPGVAANPASGLAMQRMCRFKQRKGPFLLLASSIKVAMSICRRLSPELRQTMKQYWPGQTTLIFPAVPGLPRPCYKRGRVAVRVDENNEVQYLAKACGGLIISSSLNRKGKALSSPNRALRMRLHRHLLACDSTGLPAGQPSSLLCVFGKRLQKLR